MKKHILGIAAIAMISAACSNESSFSAGDCDYFSGDPHIDFDKYGKAYYEGELLSGCICQGDMKLTSYDEGKPQYEVEQIAVIGHLTSYTEYNHETNEITTREYNGFGDKSSESVWKMGAGEDDPFAKGEAKSKKEFWLNGEVSSDGTGEKGEPTKYTSEGKKVEKANTDKYDEKIKAINNPKK